MATTTKKFTVIVQYWRGTTQMSGAATTYAGAMRIAAHNQNAYSPTFWADGRRLHDDGVGLAFEDMLEQGKIEYAV